METCHARLRDLLRYVTSSDVWCNAFFYTTCHVRQFDYSIEYTLEKKWKLTKVEMSLSARLERKAETETTREIQTKSSWLKFVIFRKPLWLNWRHEIVTESFFNATCLAQVSKKRGQPQVVQINTQAYMQNSINIETKIHWTSATI